MKAPGKEYKTANHHHIGEHADARKENGGSEMKDQHKAIGKSPRCFY